MNWRNLLATGRTIGQELREHDINFMAGSIAYSAFLSLLPLLLLLLVVTAALGNQTINEEVVGLARRYLSPTGEALLFSALMEASDRAGASLLGVVSLLWGMLRVFRGLSAAFDELYGENQTGFVRQVIDGVVVFLVIAVVTVGTAVGVALVAAGDHPLAVYLSPIVLVGGLVIAFYPMYYVFPDPDLHPIEPLPGAVVAAVGWGILEFAFGVYADLVNTVSVYGLVGSVILLLVWLYGVAFLLLLGATINVVLAGRHEDDVADGRSTGDPADPS